MKITGIDVYNIYLPYSGGEYRLSGGRVYHGFDAAIVNIKTNAGIDGWGESTPFGTKYIGQHAGGVFAALKTLAPAIIGMDPRHFDRVNDWMDLLMKEQLAASSARYSALGCFWKV